MSLLSEVARLKELEAKIAQEGHGAPDPIWCEYSDNLRNAAPTMLEVLGGFQPGDAEVLTGLLLANAPYGGPVCEVLRRMQDMAVRMEETK